MLVTNYSVSVIISISPPHAGGEDGRAGYHDGCDQYPYRPFDVFDVLMPALVFRQLPIDLCNLFLKVDHFSRTASMTPSAAPKNSMGPKLFVAFQNAFLRISCSSSLDIDPQQCGHSAAVRT